MSTFRLGETEEDKKREPEKIPNVGSNNDDSPENVSSSGQVKEIYVRGPLSHAYTEALNILLNKKDNHDREIRNESVYQALKANVFSEEENQQENELPPEAQGFIYVYDGKRLGNSELAEMFNNIEELSKEKPGVGFKAVVIENADSLLEDPVKAGNLNLNMQSFESRKVKVFFSRERAMTNLCNFIGS